MGRFLLTSHRTVRNVPLLLFLIAVLVYGASFAWSMLYRFDSLNIISTYYDDAFYYFMIAKNFADGQFSTFDGGITRTNGYHPLWMLLITPLWWVFDPDGALFAVKVFEIMLVAGAVALVVVAARLARLHWVLLFGALPVLYRERGLLLGSEAAAGLFMLGLLFLVLALYARHPMRWRTLLAAVAFLLPWVRLEYMAISLAATAAACFIEWSWRDGAPSRVPGRAARSMSAPAAFTPLLGACAGVLVYFAWNGIIFGGIVPVSGVAKQLVSAAWVEQEGGYSFVRSFQEAVGTRYFDWELLVGFEVLVYFLLVWWFGRRSRRMKDRLFLAFLAGMLALSAGHVAKFVQSVLTMHPYYVGESSWYYVPAYLMMALIVPMRCYVAVYLIHRLADGKWPRIASVSRKAILVSTALIIFSGTNFSHPYRSLESSSGGWVEASYAGTLLMNRILPEGSVVGSWDSGVIGYYSRFPVVNLDGLMNSYDYMWMRRDRGSVWETLWAKDRKSYFEEHSDFFSRSFGITHFANVAGEGGDFDNTYIVVSPFFIGLGTDLYAFRLWSEELPRDRKTEIEPTSWVWERMKPHFDVETGGVGGRIGAVIDGRLMQILARECEDGRGASALVLLFDGEGKIIDVSNPWENLFTTAKGRRPGACIDTIELPGDAVRPIRVEVLSEGGDISRLIGASPVPAAVGYGYEVYLRNRQLIYVNMQCDGDADTAPFFFVHVTPLDDSDLPEATFSSETGAAALDFAFQHVRHSTGSMCIAVRDLPEYGIAKVSTGQHVAGKQLWRREFEVGVE